MSLTLLPAMVSCVMFESYLLCVIFQLSTVPTTAIQRFD